MHCWDVVDNVIWIDIFSRRFNDVVIELHIVQQCTSFIARRYFSDAYGRKWAVTDHRKRYYDFHIQQWLCSLAIVEPLRPYGYFNRELFIANDVECCWQHRIPFRGCRKLRCDNNCDERSLQWVRECFSGVLVRSRWRHDVVEWVIKNYLRYNRALARGIVFSTEPSDCIAGADYQILVRRRTWATRRLTRKPLNSLRMGIRVLLLGQHIWSEKKSERQRKFKIYSKCPVHDRLHSEWYFFNNFSPAYKYFWAQHNMD